MHETTSLKWLHNQDRFDSFTFNDLNQYPNNNKYLMTEFDL